MAGARFAALLLTALLSAAEAHAEDFYVAPDGDDDNPGTLESPFATVERGQMAASAGDTVLIRGGVYMFAGGDDTIGVELTKSGAPDQPIRYFAYPGETPIFDLFGLTPNARVTGIDVHCSWIHIRGLEVRGTQQVIVGDSWGVRIRGDNNLIEHLDVHDNEAPGIFISSGANNVVLNCDSHHNYDPLEDGGNADGFGCHSTGGGNVLRGCRAWENSDDGYDFINAAGACTVEQSWAFRNGWIPDTNMTGANGAGFKAGGYGNPANTPASGAAHHVVRFNVAFGNRAIGFYANYHPGSIDFLNNTAFDNPSNYDMRVATGSSSSHTLRNNIVAGSGNEIVSLSGGTDDSNSWSLPVTVSNDDFESLDKMLAYAERNADGSLPSTALARLREDSDLIDKGDDLGFDFAGTAPDLGAFEHGLTPPVEPNDAGTLDAAVAIDAGSAGVGGSAGAGGVGGGAGAVIAPAGTPDAGAMPPQPAAGASAGAIAGAGGAGGALVASDASADSNGCSCRIAARPTSRTQPALLLLAITMLGYARARRR
jgi:hypothetical protein